MNPIPIDFDYFDLLSIMGVAHSRNIIKVAHGVKSKRVDDNQTDFENHINGVMGEAGVARFLKLKLDKKLSLSGDDKIKDFMKDNKTIQVKTCLVKGDYKNLFFPNKEDFRADLSILLSIKSLTSVLIEGWITREDFLNKAKQTILGKNKPAVWAVSNQNLNEPNKLLEYFKI